MLAYLFHFMFDVNQLCVCHCYYYCFIIAYFDEAVSVLPVIFYGSLKIVLMCHGYVLLDICAYIYMYICTYI